MFILTSDVMKSTQVTEILPFNFVRRFDGRASGVAAEFACQRAQQTPYVFDQRRLTHEPDAPDFAGERAETGADLDAVSLEQTAPYFRLVYARGYANAVEHPQSVLAGAR